jgi:hypothetical protein
MTILVHTLGDSTLDNYYWMLNAQGDNEADAKENSVEGRLQNKLNKEDQSYQVVSHAYDGFTTSSVLNGGEVGSVLSIFHCYNNTHTERQRAYLTAKEIGSNAESYFVKPLEDLQNSVKENANAIHYVVISVGGNDFRERLNDPIKLLDEVPKIQARYLTILENVKNLERSIRPILMFQYRLDAKNDHYIIYTILRPVGMVAVAINCLCIAGMGTAAAFLYGRKPHKIAGIVFFLLSAAILNVSTRIVPFKVTKAVLGSQEIGMATLGSLMEKFYQPILVQAKRDGIPILDLPNSFDPYDETLYLSQIEPSAKGSKLIAKGIKEIIDDYVADESRIYTIIPKGSTSVVNDPAHWKVQTEK